MSKLLLQSVEKKNYLFPKVQICEKSNGRKVQKLATKVVENAF